MLLSRRVAAISAALALPATCLVATSPLIANADVPANASACVDAGYVWVLVEHDDVVTGGCATEFDYAIDALSSAGIDFVEDGGWISSIDNREAVDPEWWSIWTLADEDEESLYWDFAPVGATELELAPGDVLGLVLQDDYTAGEDSTLPPQSDPFYEPEPTPSPSATASATPTATPTATATATATPTATKSPVRPGLPSSGN